LTAQLDREAGDDAVFRGRQTRVGVNAIVNAAGGIAYSAALVIVTPIAIDALGEALWGIWQLVAAVTAYALLLSLGLNSAISYHVSRNLASTDREHLGSSINNARIYFCAAGFFMLLVFLVAGRPLVESLVDDDLVEPTFLALALSIAITAATLPVRLYLSVVSGIQRYDLLAIFRIAAGLTLLAGTVVGFLAGMSIVGFSVIMSVVPVVPALLCWRASRRLLSHSSQRWRAFDFTHFKGMVEYSLNTLLYTAGAVILFQSMKLIASWRCGGAVAAGHMGLVVSLVQVVSVAFLPLAAVLHTRVADLQSRGLGDTLPSLVRRSLAGVGLVAIPTVVFLIWEADLVFRAWVGSSLQPETIGELASAARWMLLGQGLYVVFLPAFYAMVGVGEHRLFGVAMLGTGLVSAVLGWIVSGYSPQISSLGAAFGSSLGVLVIAVTAPITIRRFALNAAKVAFDTVLLPVAISIPGLIALAWRPRLENPLVDLLVSSLCFGFLTLPGLVWGRKRMQSHRV
jgi:O-antigen/teichoic acid export membrane protein